MEEGRQTGSTGWSTGDVAYKGRVEPRGPRRAFSEAEKEEAPGCGMCILASSGLCVLASFCVAELTGLVAVILVAVHAGEDCSRDLPRYVAQCYFVGLSGSLLRCCCIGEDGKSSCCCAKFIVYSLALASVVLYGVLTVQVVGAYGASLALRGLHLMNVACMKEAVGRNVSSNL